MAKPSQLPNLDSPDYSSSSTLIQFRHPIPLLRHPIPVNPNPDPYVLAFPNPKAFFMALKSCESKLVDQCLTGVRIGCSISASNKCTPPWWKTLFSGPHKMDFRERNKCEEREMEACLVGSSEKCGNFAKEKCLGPFGDSRVRVRVRERKGEVGRLISCVLGLGFAKGDLGLERVFVDQLGFNLSSGVSIVRGSEIMRDGNYANLKEKNRLL